MLGPILFLLHIADISKGVAPLSSLKSYVDDTRVQCSIQDPEADCAALQADLATIYNWADEVAMVFNGDKFECLRYWPGRTAKPDTHYLNQLGMPIERKAHLRDLEVEIGNDC